MIPSILLALAQSGSPPLPDFDFRTVDAQRSCRGNGETIVVCGGASTTDRQRLSAQSERYAERPLVAEVALSNGSKINLHGETLHFPGAASNRAMVAVKVPF